MISSGPRLQPREFKLFCALIAQCCGIKIAEGKTLLLQNRVLKRLTALKMNSFQRYYHYLKSPEGLRLELPNFLSAMTTNETHFFREPHHFDLLTQHLLPELLKQKGKIGEFRVWSAGCSTGQEVYTLAMVFEEWLASRPGLRYSIMGSDLNHHVLKTAAAGIYPLHLTHEIGA
jgi:chemotaxis protein methyltransferase CheR